MSKNSGLGDAPFTGKNQVSLSPRLLILSLEWKLSEQNARLTIHQTHEEQPFFSRIYPWPTPQLHRKTLDCLQLLDGSQSHISVHVSRTSSAGLGNKDLPPRMDRAWHHVRGHGTSQRRPLWRQSRLRDPSGSRTPPRQPPCSRADSMTRTTEGRL